MITYTKIITRPTITLNEKGEVSSESRSHNGDEIMFSVQKGKMLIKMGQFDTFKF